MSAVAIDREGRLLVGGSFANLNNSSGGNLARFKADGSLDSSFAPGPNGAVTGIVVQPDGRIVVTGSTLGFHTDSATSAAKLVPVQLPRREKEEGMPCLLHEKELPLTVTCAPMIHGG